MTIPRPLLLIIATGALVSCHSTASRPPATQPAPVTQSATTVPRHTHENLNAVLWVQTGAEYRGTAQQAYRLARLQLDAALADPMWTAATEQTNPSSATPPAVVSRAGSETLRSGGSNAGLKTRPTLAPGQSG